jgi:hypothetical protein
MTIRLLSRRLREDQHQGVTKLGKCITIPADSLHHRAAACRVLGNSGKPVTLETLSLIKYQVWLANTVPVKKKNGKWRMCVDFTDLNKASKKDDFPLERVDKIVDDAANSEMLSLLDMFSGYHQIRVRREDEEKTSFITLFGTFCFVRMPEGLKNAGCTFSRMIAMILHQQI